MLWHIRWGWGVSSAHAVRLRRFEQCASAALSRLVSQGHSELFQSIYMTAELYTGTESVPTPNLTSLPLKQGDFKGRASVHLLPILFSLSDLPPITTPQGEGEEGEEEFFCERSSRCVERN